MPELVPTESTSASVHTMPSPSASPSPSALSPTRSASDKQQKPQSGKKGEGEGGSASRLAAVCCGPAGAASVGVLVAVGAVLGFKAWGLYERGILGWREVGIGAGILGGVGAAEAVITRCLQQYQQKK